jgi:hypothetical protein
MGTLTPNYGLYKPAGSEFVNETTDLNNNWDTLDTQLKAVSNSIRTILMVRKTAPKTITSSTTLEPDNHLFLPVEANTIYFLDSYLAYSGAADPAGGIKIDWTGPAGFSIDWANFGVNQGALTSYDAVQQTAAGTRNLGTNGATPMTARPAGTIIVAGTPGTLTLRWAQGVSNATGTTLGANSVIRLMKF